MRINFTEYDILSGLDEGIAEAVAEFLDEGTKVDRFWQIVHATPSMPSPLEFLLFLKKDIDSKSRYQ